MKRNTLLLTILVALSFLVGWLLSEITWIGRLGIRWVHRDYTFLKTWYFNVGLSLTVWLLIVGLHQLIRKMLPFSTARIIYSILLLATLAGLYFTYSDFRHDFSHRLMGEKFHLGAYLFWAGMILISCFYLFASPLLKKKIERPKQRRSR